MHFVQAKKILSNKNGLNIYRGCTHGCIYCDSRSKCYNLNHGFTDVEVKENAIKLLDLELSKKRDKIMVSTGSMSDPYLPIESNLLLTRKMLEVINKYQCGVHILTKSDLILRDLDLLKEINKHSKVVISMTLTTMDDNLSKILEPNVCTTTRRIEVLEILKSNGIEVGAWLCPFLPFINDDENNVLSILENCIRIKVKYALCFSIGVTLREGNREYFYANLDKSFKGLRNKYELIYRDSYILDSKNSKKLMLKFKDICNKNNIMYDIDEIFKYCQKYERKYEQLSLF